MKHFTVKTLQNFGLTKDQAKRFCMLQKMNDKGYILIVTTAGLLVLLSLIGVCSIQTSNTEVMIARNHTEQMIDFYKYESCINAAPLFLAGTEQVNPFEFSIDDTCTCYCQLVFDIDTGCELYAYECSSGDLTSTYLPIEPIQPEEVINYEMNSWKGG